MRPLIIDSFAGGGGASTGIEMALGRSPDFAINHNAAALAMHEANHPETVHLSENIYKVDPLDYVAGKHIGLAWFSPDCKHFSKAKGGKPVERNVRDLAWIIPGWVERIQKSGGKVDVIILENVEEFKDWGPLRETERGLMPCPDGRGQTFQKWCRKIRSLGGRIEHRELRACDYGAPTIRKRLFIVIRLDGKKIVWPKPTHHPPASRDAPEASPPAAPAGRGKRRGARSGLRALPERPDHSAARLPYRTAAEIIDWSLPCPSIFDTAEEIMAKYGLRAIRPLAAATDSRIARGVKRYVLDAARPFLVSVAHGYSGGRREYPLDEPHGVVTAGGISHAVVSPSIAKFQTGSTGHGMDEPLATVTANSFIKKPGGAAPLGMIAPVLTYAQQGGANRSVEEPAHTICASTKDQNAIIVPTLVQTGYGEREGQEPRSLDPHVPLGTVVAGGVKHAAASVFLAQHNNDSRREGGVNPGRPACEPVSTVTANPQQGVIAAFVSRQFGTSTGHEMDRPTGTATADVNKSALVAPHLMTMRNAGKPFNGADAPTHTVTAGGAGLSLVAPFMQKYSGTGDGSTMDDPCHSVTTKDRFGFVEALGALPPFTPDQEARAREVADFLRRHGFWDEREFVTIDAGGVTVVMVDIGMRMLTPRELFNAQGFPPDYKIDFIYQGKPLPKNVQISCCGNSVSPPVAEALVAANCEHLMEFREAAE